MKTFRSLAFLVIAAAILIGGTVVSSVGGGAREAFAQGVQRLSTFTGGAQVTGIGYPCTVSCFIMLTSGTVTATGSSEVVVTAPNITANSTVIFGLKTAAGTIAGQPYMSSVTAGTGFGVKAGASDTSVYNYIVFN